VTDTNEAFDPDAVEGPPLIEWNGFAKSLQIFEHCEFFCPSLLSSRSTLVDFVRLHSAIALNAIGGPCQDGYESSIYLAASYANHDCNPNTRYGSNPDPFHALLKMSRVERHEAAVTFTAKRDIAEGEDITIAYCDTDVDVETRKQSLLLSYGFECTCATCVREEAAKQQNVNVKGNKKVNKK
jgi:hypothetical protein